MLSFSWLGQKINKKIDGSDVYGHDADDSDLCQLPEDDAVPRHIDTDQYSNQIRSHCIFAFDLISIRNIQNIDSNEIPHSHP